jgi:CNT family concentrative nucleoside transporter
MRWIGLAGIVVIFAIAYLFSANRRAIRWYTVLWGFALQVLFAFLVLYWEAGKNALERFSMAITGAISYADQGGAFVFGWLTGRMEKVG